MDEGKNNRINNHKKGSKVGRMERRKDEFKEERIGRKREGRKEGRNKE